MFLCVQKSKPIIVSSIKDDLGLHQKKEIPPRKCTPIQQQNLVFSTPKVVLLPLLKFGFEEHGKRKS